ncbi:hypothetical protein BN424_378 [Carnobacterium maltaromaticum LMA28]|uniref:Uncharacterized protein n=1 Tax=Carnobacterium maltaromaticum LMA28 TaxID=1234679 RepID=K8EDN7_CARML|nr:hypothetical protein BN424_378 [Carnobacterium maltaromaticum LMA28]
MNGTLFLVFIIFLTNSHFSFLFFNSQLNYPDKTPFLNKKANFIVF